MPKVYCSLFQTTIVFATHAKLFTTDKIYKTDASMLDNFRLAQTFFVDIVIFWDAQVHLTLVSLGDSMGVIWVGCNIIDGPVVQS